MVQSNQINPKSIAIFPPCLLSYLFSHCRTVQFNDFCAAGSIANLTTLFGQVNISRAKVSSTLEFPNMYNKTDVLTLLGVLTTALTTSTPILKSQPYIFNPNYPFQIEVVAFKYATTTTVLGTTTTTVLTPSNGSMYWPPEGFFIYFLNLFLMYSFEICVTYFLVNLKKFNKSAFNSYY
jgi:hypothetical protein